ncbi:endonuclease/exonuclease/phosphatase family metal-dependent hydrolase [Amycolatopsis thermophila]|uniref:Endonuclease/exonuclease/phosphatase family metal-dependent hydrolase n=2 Tax=Amycolatopsis thermophila TaxID=206084 RepID=A0ABU0ELE5_9PSEU|nr:endonuclease/exonuclease/phosphatase family protein [Amycolatopsis thermophila]MDQ0376111.1 endonuclease/exonuclease/phosphatase family metal-dependent hydrolase [Amycolatopsis thermophila]
MRLAAVVVAVIVALGAPPAAAAPPARLIVAGYNIHAGAGEDGVFDLTRTANALRELHADVVGLQEVDVHWDARSEYRDEAGELARALGMHVFFAPIYDLDPPAPGAPRRQYGVAVLSRHPILAARNLEITRLSTLTPDASPAPAPAPGFAEVTVAVRGTPVRVYTTHLDYRADPSVRRAQVADTCSILGRLPGPEILTGDFNAEPSAPELAPLWTDLVDADPHGPTYPAAQPVKRLDFVTASRQFGIRAASTVATTASDHRPVIATLTLSR